MKKIILIIMIMMITNWSCGLSWGNNDSGKWFYWLEPGAFVMYTFPTDEIPEIPGWLTASLGRYNLIQLLNETSYKFDNLTLTWSVLEVDDDRASVEYTLRLYNVTKVHFEKGFLKIDVLLGDVLFYMTVWVKLDTLDIYDQDDLYLGRWPFWVHATESNVSIDIVHNVLQYSGEDGYVLNNITIGLIDLSDYANVVKIDNPELEGLDTPFGFFNMKRLISWSPVGEQIVTNNHTHYTAQGIFPVLYDKSSLVMLAYSHSVYVDDVILRIFPEIRQGIFITKPLVIRSTNIDFNPQEEQDEEPYQGGGSDPLLLPALAVASCLSIGCVIYVWRKKSS